MPRPCTVCAHLDRADIDRRLAFQVCNVSALAREYGLKRDAVVAHRANHLPEFLPAFQAAAGALTLDALQAEAQRLYVTTLDALALAEAGVMERMPHWNEETKEWEEKPGRKVSITGVARMIREARAGLDQLTRLAADRGTPEGRPSSGADAELGAAIRTQLERVVSRAATVREQAAIEEGDALPDVIEVQSNATSRTLVPHDAASAPGGGSRAAGGAAGGVVIPLDSANAPETPEESQENTDVPLLNPEQVRIAAASIGVTEESFLASIRQARTQYVRHPEWEGNPAASEEERRAEGFGAIPVKDNRINPDPTIRPVQ